MFNIAIDECGRKCHADELVKDKTVAEIGNAKKRKYTCVTCVDGKHPVSLNIRHNTSHVDKKARNYTALAWFSHHGTGNAGNYSQDRPCPETVTHWHAKHILSEHVCRYYFTSSQCIGCTKHTKIENGTGAIGKVEHTESTFDGTFYRFDAVLIRGELDQPVISSVLEVYATHETPEEKRQYCLGQGYTFAEFHADHVLEAHYKAPPNTVYELENLKIHRFECKECVYVREQAVIAKELELASETHAPSEQVRLQTVAHQEQIQSYVSNSRDPLKEWLSQGLNPNPGLFDRKIHGV